MAEGDAIAAHKVHDFLSREVLGAAEQHVFHEVSYAPLVILLEHRTSLDKQAEVGLLLGFLAAPHVISKAILQHTLAHRSINGYFLTVDDIQVCHQQRVILLLGEG